MNSENKLKTISNLELSIQIENLTENFSELVKTISRMHSDLSMKIKVLEVKHITTVNSLKSIKESLRMINRKIMIKEDQLSNRSILQPAYTSNLSCDSIRKRNKLKKRKSKLKKSPKFIESPGEVIKEFNAFTESEFQSEKSKEQFFENLKTGRIPKKEKRLDSFFSKRMKPIDLLLDIPKNLNLENLDESEVKTPKKNEGAEFKPDKIEDLNFSGSN